MVTSAHVAIDPNALDDFVVAVYRQMVVLRAVDDRLARLQREGRIPTRRNGSARGEEATIVGAAAALRTQDWIFPSSRELGAALWRGVSLQSYAHHLFGDALDLGKGRQPPDFFGARKAKIASPTGIAGAQIAHAVGFAWGAKSRRDDVAALAFLDEGATASADFHNAMNFAGVFKVPLVVLIRCKDESVARPRGIAYGVADARVDGGDAFAVLGAVREAVAIASSGGGATLVEAILPRPGAAADPIARARRTLDARSLWNDAKQNDLEKQIENEVTIAIAEAEKTAAPPIETLFDDVYAELPWHLREQRASLVSLVSLLSRKKPERE